MPALVELVLGPYFIKSINNIKPIRRWFTSAHEKNKKKKKSSTHFWVITLFNVLISGAAGYAGEWNFAQTGNAMFFVMHTWVSYVHSLPVIIYCLLCIAGWGASRFLSTSWTPSPILSWILPYRKEEFPCQSWCCESWSGLWNWKRRFRHHLAIRVQFFSYFKFSLQLTINMLLPL